MPSLTNKISTDASLEDYIMLFIEPLSDADNTRLSELLLRRLISRKVLANTPGAFTRAFSSNDDDVQENLSSSFVQKSCESSRVANIIQCRRHCSAYEAC